MPVRLDMRLRGELIVALVAPCLLFELVILCCAMIRLLKDAPSSSPNAKILSFSQTLDVNRLQCFARAPKRQACFAGWQYCDC